MALGWGFYSTQPQFSKTKAKAESQTWFRLVRIHSIRVVCFSSKCVLRFVFWNCEVGGLIVLSHTNTPRLSTWSNSCCSIVIVVWTMSENYTLEKQVVTIAFRHQRSTAVLAWIRVLYLVEIAIQTM